MQIERKDTTLHEVILGGDTEHLQWTVKAGNIFCAESIGSYTVVGCAVTPGFEFQDFKLISKGDFVTDYPQYISLLRFVR